MWLPHYLRSPALDSSVVLNYATWNPADTSADISLSGGNLVATKTTVNVWRSSRATVGKASGKWYWEINITNVVQYAMVGIANSSALTSNYFGSDSNGWSYFGSGGRFYLNATNIAYGNSFTTGDVIGVALDMNAGKIWFSKNNTWQASGDPVAGTNPATTGLSGTLYPGIGLYANTESITANFGASAFTYTPPSGFASGVYS